MLTISCYSEHYLRVDFCYMTQQLETLEDARTSDVNVRQVKDSE